MQGDEVVRQPGKIAESEGAARRRVQRGQQHQRGRDPRQPGPARLGKRERQRQPGEQREGRASIDTILKRRSPQPTELAATPDEGKPA